MQWWGSSGGNSFWSERIWHTSTSCNSAEAYSTLLANNGLKVTPSWSWCLIQTLAAPSACVWNGEAGGKMSVFDTLGVRPNCDGKYYKGLSCIPADLKPAISADATADLLLLPGKCRHPSCFGLPPPPASPARPTSTPVSHFYIATDLINVIPLVSDACLVLYHRGTCYFTS